MKTELVSITPNLARKWLKCNVNNRPLRPSHVEALRVSLVRGEHQTTHQGIAFDTQGRLLDGQHRLAAIAKMDDSFVWPMLVTWGLKRDIAFPVVDFMQKKRSTSDVLGVDPAVGQVANYLAIMVRGRRAGLTAVYIRPFAKFIEDEVKELTAFCPTISKTWSSTPVRAAAAISMKELPDRDFVKQTYQQLVLADFDNMPSSARALFKACLTTSLKSTHSADYLFARCLKVFDAELANLRSVKLINLQNAMAEMREYLRQNVKTASEGE